jgi:hypothetical protein
MIANYNAIRLDRIVIEGIVLRKLERAIWIQNAIKFLNRNEHNIVFWIAAMVVRPFGNKGSK